MFDESVSQPFNRSDGRSDNAVASGLRFAHLEPEQLLGIYEEIRSRLPPLRIAKMNVEEELLLQFHTVRKLQSEIIGEDGVAPNQKAQVANTVGNCLERITKMQDEIYDSERFKTIESLVIRMLRKVPKEVAEEFLKDYEAAGLSLELT